MPRRERASGAVQAAGGGWQPVHRFALVQQLMDRRCMTEADALATFEQLTGSNSVDEFRAMLAEQNTEMSSMSLEIRTLRYPVDKQTYVAFVNKLADEPSKLATHYSHGQREFFKHVLEAIAADEAAEGGVGAAASTHLLNMDLSRPAAAQDADAEAAQAAVAAAKKMTKTEKEQTLRQLVNDGWLQHSSRSGHYCIGVRSFMELPDMLLEFDMPQSTKDAWMNLL